MSPSPQARSTNRWSLAAIRVVTVILAAMALAQAVLAGSFLDGHAESLDLHMIVGVVMVAVALVLTILSGIGILHGMPPGLLISAAVLTVVLIAQVYAGMAGLVGLHVPLGVLLVTGIAIQATQAFKPFSPRLTSSVAAAESQ